MVLTPTGDWLEEIAANSAIGEILDLPEADQRSALIHGLGMGNVAASRQLHRFCCEPLGRAVDTAVRPPASASS